MKQTNETMHSNNPIVPYISLCSGYEGIGLGLHRCIPNLRAVAYCEREAFAIANLVAKMESGLLDAAPVFTDVTNFPWADYAPYMAGGILSFGWPCQPVSCAGKRKATEDERWLFDIIAGGISILRPGMLFAENVEGLLSARMPDGSSVFGHCIERLESLHYKVAAGIFSASEVGAPHQRKRVFIFGLAHPTSQRDRESQQGLPKSDQCVSGQQEGSADAGRCLQAWPSRPGQPQHGWEPPRVVANSLRSRGKEPEHLDANLPSEPSRGDTEGLGNAELQGLAGGSGSGNGKSKITTERYEKRNRLGQVERTMGYTIDGTSDGLGYAELSSLCDSELAEIREWMVKCDNRTDELRLLGNGVVPATAERAFRVLMEELTK
jgi:DNA (cytosine-5)-methyltransferase 1